MLIDINLEMKVGSCSEHLNGKAVLETENMIKQKLHNDYIEFLKRCNGGSPKKQYFDFGNNIKVVEKFLYIIENYDTESEGMYDVGVVWSQIKDRLNDYLIPFAVLFAGDFLCFDYEKTPDNPKVVIWNHDLSDERKPHTEIVANNLNTFLPMLYYKSDKELFEQDKLLKQK
jgi:SMI1-KNR4 cell-wall